MTETILTLNAGSSSLKFRVFARDGLRELAGGKATRIGGAAQFNAYITDGPTTQTTLAPGADHHAALESVIAFLKAHASEWQSVAIAHRVVHGGTRYTGPVRVTPQVITDLEALNPLAPLHQPHNLAAIAASERVEADVPDIACFDTAFHAGHGPMTTRFAIPAEFHEAGVRRYGFHGLSYAWVAESLRRDHPALHAGRVIAAHLGNGSSLCAMSQGQSRDTTMSMSTLDGVPMGTRSGAIDPGAVMHLMREHRMSAAEVETMLYDRSGLLGLSGISNDVATLLDDGSDGARFALDYFARRCAQAAASLAVVLGGIDAMVFTGGIGEHASSVRERIIAQLAPLGDFRTLVIPANEERMMALEALSVLERDHAA